MKKPLMKKPWGRGDGGSSGQAPAVVVMFLPLTDDDPSSAAPSTSSDDAFHNLLRPTLRASVWGSTHLLGVSP